MVFSADELPHLTSEREELVEFRFRTNDSEGVSALSFLPSPTSTSKEMRISAHVLARPKSRDVGRRRGLRLGLPSSRARRLRVSLLSLSLSTIPFKRSLERMQTTPFNEICLQNPLNETLSAMNWEVVQHVSCLN